MGFAAWEGISGFDDATAAFGGYGSSPFPVPVWVRDSFGTWEKRFEFPRGVINHVHALVITAFAWVIAAAVAAVPLSMSGNYPTYLDAAFDAISGFTVSGLTVVVDLDHMANSHNMWRHLTQFFGGQGIVVTAISFTVGLKAGAFSLYMAEGRDERILPNVLHTARFIWTVTAA